jgi:DNA-directed RNA polymerase sigma subunit (sigma70/sigma32)
MTNEAKLLRRRERVVRNIVARHGRAGLRRLIEGFRANESGQVLGDDLGVTRERVRQWKEILGQEVRSYMVHPTAENALHGED